MQHPLLTGATAVLVAGLTSGCLQSAPEPAPAPRPTPLAQLDTAHLVVPRKPFCDRIPEAAVRRAIDGEVAESDQWGSGAKDTDPAGSGTRDVTHEFGCSWSDANGVTARAWVFARPVTRQFAAQVGRQTSKKQDCATPPGPAFGTPSTLQVCRLGGGVRRIRHAGLFGDAYLSCEVAEATGQVAKLRQRADAWCVEVVNAASGS